MVRGLYIASTGMVVQSKQMDLISNDLANATTTGYKKSTSIAESFPEVLLTRLNDYQNGISNDQIVGSINFGATIDEVYTDYTQGSVINSSNPTDLAIQGDGFFVINAPEGELYTRDGSFQIDQNGNLVTKEGYAVMGMNGPISFGEDFLNGIHDIVIKETGEIQINGETIDQIQLTAFTDNQNLEKLGDNFYRGGEKQPFDGYVLQYFTEASNVNPVTTMVDMIKVSRAYETNQKMIQTQDQLLGKAINELGK